MSTRISADVGYHPFTFCFYDPYGLLDYKICLFTVLGNNFNFDIGEPVSPNSKTKNNHKHYFHRCHTL